MRFELVDGVTHIYLDPPETERIALRTIAKASFTAAGVDPDLSINSHDYQMSDEEADLFIRPTARAYDGLVLEMNKVDGRLCSTVIYRIADGHFTLYDSYYKRFRGNPEPMWQLATTLLSSTTNPQAIHL